MITIRYATLADTAEITAIHVSDISQWQRSFFDDEGERQRVAATYEECSLIDRWEAGGPWMTPELCAIHLNRLLKSPHIPLVAELEGRVIGELELFIGQDELYGHNCNLSVFYVHQDYRGRGHGSILLEEAIVLARELQCDTFTTYHPDIPAYYERMGLALERTLKLVVVPTLAGKTLLPARRHAVPPLSRLRGKAILSGRIVSREQLHWMLLDEGAPGSYAIPAAWRGEEMSYKVGQGAESSYVTFRDRTGRNPWAFVHLWGAAWSPELIQSVLVLGHRVGFSALHFMVAEEDLPYLSPFAPSTIAEGTTIHCLRL